MGLHRIFIRSPDRMLAFVGSSLARIGLRKGMLILSKQCSHILRLTSNLVMSKGLGWIILSSNDCSRQRLVA
ncbi:hypothetical protein A2U01_0063283 [Trifolium medium]|uniref:Uncharacterized protein n=1 Tax=Trifolium medium TaxID=97028 RepID=A0A392RZJ8_9FABA|nr:hypothetical protein [Trifolium medium]